MLDLVHAYEACVLLILRQPPPPPPRAMPFSVFSHVEYIIVKVLLQSKQNTHLLFNMCKLVRLPEQKSSNFVHLLMVIFVSLSGSLQ